MTCPCCPITDPDSHVVFRDEVVLFVQNERHQGALKHSGCGATGGQEVFHAHMHVIPRFTQEPLEGKGIRSLLKSDANRW